MSQWDDRGFTLIELLVAMVLFLVASALGLSALQGFGAARDHQGAVDELVSDLRKAGQRAISEGRTYCVHIDDAGDRWTSYRKACSTTTGTVVDPASTPKQKITVGSLIIATPVSASCPAAGQCIYFYPRGTATQASVGVARTGASTISVTVEGLTGRVDRD